MEEPDEAFVNTKLRWLHVGEDLLDFGYASNLVKAFRFCGGLSCRPIPYRQEWDVARNDDHVHAAQVTDLAQHVGELLDVQSNAGQALLGDGDVLSNDLFIETWAVYFQTMTHVIGANVLREAQKGAGPRLPFIPAYSPRRRRSCSRASRLLLPRSPPRNSVWGETGHQRDALRKSGGEEGERRESGGGEEGERRESGGGRKDHREGA